MPDVDGGAQPPRAGWAERAADRSPAVERSRRRSVQRAEQVVEAAGRLVRAKGSDFTTHELAKEAGIAVQTLYKHFPSKDHVILAVLEDMVSQASSLYEQRAAELPDPVARLESYVRSMATTVTSGTNSAASRFVAAEHWRLAQLHPEELTGVIRPFCELLRVQLVAAVDQGLLSSSDPAYDAWLATQLLLATHHHYTFAGSGQQREDVADRMWGFCYAGWGGVRTTLPAGRGLQQSAS